VAGHPVRSEAERAVHQKRPDQRHTLSSTFSRRERVSEGRVRGLTFNRGNHPAVPATPTRPRYPGPPSLS
jgi:hypothetical protein